METTWASIGLVYSFTLVVLRWKQLFLNLFLEPSSTEQYVKFLPQGNIEEFNRLTKLTQKNYQLKFNNPFKHKPTLHGPITDLQHLIIPKNLQLWPPGWASLHYGTLSGPPLSHAGIGHHGYWLLGNPLLWGSLPEHQHLS